MAELPNKETLKVEFKSDRKRLPDDDLVTTAVAMRSTAHRAPRLGRGRHLPGCRSNALIFPTLSIQRRCSRASLSKGSYVLPGIGPRPGRCSHSTDR
jgi:hypothetical protein